MLESSLGRKCDILFVLHNIYFIFFVEPAILLGRCAFSKMASKRKFAGDNSHALVPVKKPKQNQIAISNQGGAIQAVSEKFFSVYRFDVRTRRCIHCTRATHKCISLSLCEIPITSVGSNLTFSLIILIASAKDVKS